MNKHHRRSVYALVGVLLLDIASGIVMALIEHVPAWHGIYCTIGYTTTDGCDLPLHSAASYWIATIAMVLFVPLWTGVFSLFTTGLLADHIDKSGGSQ